MVVLPVNEFDEYISYVEEKLNVFDTERTQKYRQAIKRWIDETNDAPAKYRNSIAALELMKKRGLGEEFDDDFTDLSQYLSEEFKCEHVLTNRDVSLKKADQEYNDKVNKLLNELKVYSYDDCDKELKLGHIKVEYPVNNDNNSEVDSDRAYYDDDCDRELNFGLIEVEYL